MDTYEFEKSFDGMVDAARAVLQKKAREYAGSDDRLYNFKVAAQLQGESPMQALAGMMAKHTVSLYQMVSSCQTFPPEVWNEKILDHFNYLLLLNATLIELRAGGFTLEETQAIPAHSNLNPMLDAIHSSNIPSTKRIGRA